jgi:hypothetical protein
MRLEDGVWRCARCDAVIDVPRDFHSVLRDVPTSSVRVEPTPARHVLIVNGEEVHSCPTAQASP